MTDMARQVRTIIRYDGPALIDHEMDVQDLAPALLALADIVQIANRKFNGEAAHIKVLVDANVEQKCFQISISLVQSFLDQAATLLGSKDYTTAKEIGGIIGIAASSGVSLFKLYKWLADNKASAAGITINADSASGTTTIAINGSGNTVIVGKQTAELAIDPEVTKRIKSVLRPLEREGYTDLAFLQGDDQLVHFDKAEAESVIALPGLDSVDKGTVNVSSIKGAVRIKSPQYEGSAKWSLMWNGRAIDAEMVGKAADWVKDFQENKVSAPPHTILIVTMTEEVKLDDKGNAVGKASYAVHEVHGVMPPPKQLGLAIG
jgi:hypothetical protein